MMALRHHGASNFPTNLLARCILGDLQVIATRREDRGARDVEIVDGCNIISRRPAKFDQPTSSSLRRAKRLPVSNDAFDGFGIFGNDSKQKTCRSVRNTPFLFPLLHGAQR
jgi:hypothetical protein